MGYTELSVDGHSGTAVVSYAARPQVLGVSPKTGYARGGAIASVVGAGFMDEKAACVYGGVHAPAEFISSSLLRCESPSLSLGAVTVEVAAGSGTIVSESEMTVSVIADMRVQYVTPSSGPTQGGNVITVYGKYFVGIEPVACKLGSIGPLDARDNDATASTSRRAWSAWLPRDRRVLHAWRWASAHQDILTTTCSTCTHRHLRCRL